jgi:exosortase B
MSFILPQTPADRIAPRDWLKWLPVALGLLVLYVPSFIDLAATFWRTDVGGHGPIILAIVLWLLWRERIALLGSEADTPMPKIGGALITFGLLLYVLGRSQEFFQFEVGSLIPLLYGIVLALRGTKATKRLWFPIFFLCFLVPLPGSLLDSILVPLKQYVSAAVESLLYVFNYPVARTGVVLTIGPYQLLIANACSGLNSMIALSGVGLLFVYLIRHPSKTYNAILLLSILPIAFLANIVRVLLLMLVTYYWGDSAGQGFHDYAGYMEIVFAFGMFFAMDAILSPPFRRSARSAQRAPSPLAGEGRG